MLPLVHRLPTWGEMEKLRLILSSYQDGTGMLAVQGSTMTRPGWRDFERAVAAAFGGDAQESKAIFDVLIHDPDNFPVQYGIGCKMRGTLRETERKGRVTVEVANAAGEFWDRINTKGIDQRNYREYPEEVGASLIEVVEGWHEGVSLGRGGKVDLDGSSYLVLSWEKRTGRYQMHQFDIDLPEPDTISWSFPPSAQGGTGRRLLGEDETGKLFEWYGEAGGQLKYYPKTSSAIWVSETFTLEPLPEGDYGLALKTKSYFPEAWARAESEGQ